MSGATRAAPTPRRDAVPSAVLAGALAAFVFAGGGSVAGDDFALVGSAVVAAAAGALVLGLLGAIRLPRLEASGLLLAVGLAATALWAAVSISWSIAGDVSLDWAARWSVYLAALVLGVALTRSAEWLGAALALVLGAALGWALLGVAIPSLFEDGDRVARLREPVGYWNALALLADAAVVLGLWIARDGRARRAAGGALVFVAIVALLLTQSRAGVAAGAIVAAVWLARSSRRLDSGLTLLLAALPAALVGGWAFTRSALVDDMVGRAAREHDGTLFGIVTLAGLAVAAAACALVPVERLSRERSRLVARGLALAACAAALIAVVALVAAVGNPASWAREQVSRGECANDPGRLADLCANNRLAWWGEAVDVARAHPVAGTGAGTFAIARLAVRDDGTPVREPHSVALQLLADTGIVGLALGLVVLLAAVVGLLRALRRVSGREHEAALALAALPLAFALHALVDYDLDFPAVAGPTALVLGGSVALGRPALAGRRPGSAIAVGAVGAAVVALIALPALARRDVQRSADALSSGRLAAAEQAARRARSLDPLSLDPLFALAAAADAGGSRATAVGWYERATRQQPRNPAPWIELGYYHFIETRDLCAAYQAFNAAYTLDPNSRRWVPGGPLDVSKDAVNDGACER